VAKVLILYYSVHGNIETMAETIAAGAHSAGAIVDVKRVPEPPSQEIIRFSCCGFDRPAPIATITDLERYDAIIMGSATRVGCVCSQMAAFLDQASVLWVRGALNGKIGSAFASTASPNDSNQVALFSMITNLLRFGMIVVGLPYSFADAHLLDEVNEGAPFGAAMTAGTDGSLRPNEKELAGARLQGRHVAEIARKMFG
jgi:NAD(P)H dehydrogenase (quinone)